ARPSSPRPARPVPRPCGACLRAGAGPRAPAARADRRAFRRRRLRRCAGAPHRPSPFRALEPAGGDRQPPRRRRPHRRRGRGAQRRRRRHAAARLHRHPRREQRLPQPALQPARGTRSGCDPGGVPQRHRRPPFRPRAGPARAAGARAAAPRRAHLRFRGERHLHPHGGRALHAGERGALHPCAVPRLLPGIERPDGGEHPADVREPAHHPARRARGPRAAARHHQRRALAGAAGRAHRGRGRGGGLRRNRLVHHRRPRQHAGAAPGPAQRGSARRPGRTRPARALRATGRHAGRRDVGGVARLPRRRNGEVDPRRLLRQHPPRL
ncbi:MAG: BUG/TctC family periplasmic protein, partial [uncultured Solirubrobacteraceae bacterium]